MHPDFYPPPKSRLLLVQVGGVLSAAALLAGLQHLEQCWQPPPPVTAIAPIGQSIAQPVFPLTSFPVTPVMMGPHHAPAPMSESSESSDNYLSAP